jgi:hypothetical protein
MTTDEWAQIQDNPRQRDTEGRAEKSKHLLKPSKDHAVVAAARLPNGELTKLDGHTRSLMWQRGDVDKPEKLNVVVYDVHSIEEAKELYTHYDSQAAVEKAADRVYGGLRESGIGAVSDIVRNGLIANAINIVSRNIGMKGREYEVMRTISASIAFLDTLNLRRGMLPTGIVGAILLTHHKHGTKAERFWRAVLADRGTKANGQMDGIQAAHEVIVWARGRYGGGQNEKVCRRAITAFEKWSVGESLQRLPRPLNMKGYMRVVA